jgi:ribose 5-phosphate isomerase B
MTIFIGADHRGFELKEKLKQFLVNKGYTVFDKGNDHYDQNDDYPDFAAAVAKEVGEDPDNRRGILICGSGVGIDVVANKFYRIRSVLANNPDQAFSSRNDVDTNVLCLAADFLDEEAAKKILSVWLQTSFSKEERHKRRLRKIGEIEISNR